MAGTRKTRVPMVEQIRLINECRQSGMTDADWCRVSIPIEISILFGNSEHPFPERKNMPFRSRVQPFI